MYGLRKYSYGVVCVRVSICSSMCNNEFLDTLEATFCARLNGCFTYSFVIKREKTLLILGDKGQGHRIS